MKLRSFVLALFLVAGCSTNDANDTSDIETADPRLAEELPIGDTNEPGTGKGDEFAHNGEEDFSEFCKEIPDLEPLVDPEITVSVDGRTLHLVDRQGDYDRVFPVGLGKISDGESLTPLSDELEDGVYYARGDYTGIVDGATIDRRKWAWRYSCRIWSGSKYYNPRSGENEFRSYFAGLPFIRLEGPARAVYGIHGPIDNYWREGGGELYRGYVSGGCTRMDPDDLVEIYARITGHKTPVNVQQEIEFDENGLSVDSDRFMSAHCLVDTDCADTGAICATTTESETGFCTLPCSHNSDCPIRENTIIGSAGILSYCVSDTAGLVETDGYCAIEGNTKTNNNCRSYPANLTKQRLPLLGLDGITTNVCAL